MAKTNGAAVAAKYELEVDNSQEHTFDALGINEERAKQLMDISKSSADATDTLSGALQASAAQCNTLEEVVYTALLIGQAVGRAHTPSIEQLLGMTRG